MIEWREIDSYAFYADTQRRNVGTFVIDKSKTSTPMYRLRLFRDNKPDEHRVIRIKRGNNNNLRHAERIRTVYDLHEILTDDMNANALLIGLKPIGEARMISRKEIRLTSLHSE